MTKEQWKEIKESTEWVRIDYKSASTHGYMIIKYKLLELNLKKFNKKFNECEWYITRNYQPNMKDILYSALRTYKKRKLTMETRLNSELSRTWIDGENVLRFKQEIRKCERRIDLLQRRLNLWN